MWQIDRFMDMNAIFGPNTVPTHLDTILYSISGNIQGYRIESGNRFMGHDCPNEFQLHGTFTAEGNDC
jgi:hypothetical protein